MQTFEAVLGGLPLDHLYKVTIDGLDKLGESITTLSFNLDSGTFIVGMFIWL